MAPGLCKLPALFDESTKHFDHWAPFPDGFGHLAPLYEPKFVLARVGRVHTEVHAAPQEARCQLPFASTHFLMKPSRELGT